MASGYEKTPDYGGPEPRRPNFREVVFILSAVAAAAAIWLTLG